ncbi:MAG: alanine--tRNA ligase-related protein [Candidatus Thorarchaeota archaeon]
MTKKLYWEDSYETKFTAKVTSVKETGFVLDKTLFYPESGNQLSDRGYIKIEDFKVKIEKITKDGDDIIHHIPSDLKDKIKIGDKVEGEIDWQYRYGLMKAHSSQHVFSAVLKETYDIDTLHAILNHEEVFLQISQKLDYEQLKEILYEVNKICTAKNYKISANIIPRTKVQEIADKIRSQIPNEPEVRLMEIENLDLVCCGGTHVQNTTEIGSIFVYDFKKGNKIRYYVGNKATLNSSNININIINLANNLNIPVLKLREIVKKRLELFEDIQNQHKDLSYKFLDAISKSQDKVINNIPLYYIDFDIDIKILSKSLSVFPQDSLLIVEMGKNKIRLLSLSEKIDANKLLQRLVNKYRGKGGGNSKSAQVILEKMPESLLSDVEHILRETE